MSLSDTPGLRPTAPGAFPEAARQAVYEVIALRRDVRGFRQTPIEDERLVRILQAAHLAGSVGFMQPWDFVLIRSPARKAELHELFRRANERAASRYAGDRRSRYAALKLQGILDAPLCICVTCDTGRGGPHVLGRDTIRETDVYSTCLAVQNLWLAARAEGIGVGWVSIVDNAELAAALDLPAGVIPVAFLCVGYPVEFPDAPLLDAVGWRSREDLLKLVHFDGWGGEAGDGWQEMRRLLGGRGQQDAPPAAAPEPGDPPDLGALISRIAPATAARERARARLDTLTKPVGSLGRLEELAVRMAGAQDRDLPRVGRAIVLVFAADHGCCTEGVSAYLPEVTARLCYGFVAGGGVINMLARGCGAELKVVDVGVDHDFEGAAGVVHRKVRRGTRNLAQEPALTRAETVAALQAGASLVLADPAPGVVALGEVGIGNTTSAAALLGLLTGADAHEVVGAGTGVTGEAMRRKTAVVQRALDRCRARQLDPIGKLAEVGGLEIAALVGAVLAAAGRRIPVLLDGFTTGVAALLAAELAPAVRDHLIASHRSPEPGHDRVLERLGLEPLLDLGLRLGEGSGAALALPLLDSACRLMHEVHTFREAGLEEMTDPRAAR
jgi:nicotinate-nucleotide--dimethylbenzimidazole phosphoribosyltransferase